MCTPRLAVLPTPARLGDLPTMSQMEDLPPDGKNVLALLRSMVGICVGASYVRERATTGRAARAELSLPGVALPGPTPLSAIQLLALPRV